MSPDQKAGHNAWSILVGGIESLDKAWPLPNLLDVIRLAKDRNPDLIQKAAREAREIVQSQGKAPNIVGLFRLKLYQQQKEDL